MRKSISSTLNNDYSSILITKSKYTKKNNFYLGRGENETYVWLKEKDSNPHISILEDKSNNNSLDITITKNLIKKEEGFIFVCDNTKIVKELIALCNKEDNLPTYVLYKDKIQGCEKYQNISLSLSHFNSVNLASFINSSLDTFYTDYSDLIKEKVKGFVVLSTQMFLESYSDRNWYLSDYHKFISRENLNLVVNGKKLSKKLKDLYNNFITHTPDSVLSTIDSIMNEYLIDIISLNIFEVPGTIEKDFLELRNERARVIILVGEEQKDFENAFLISYIEKYCNSFLLNEKSKVLVNNNSQFSILIRSEVEMKFGPNFFNQTKLLNIRLIMTLNELLLKEMDKGLTSEAYNIFTKTDITFFGKSNVEVVKKLLPTYSHEVLEEDLTNLRDKTWLLLDKQNLKAYKVIT